MSNIFIKVLDMSFTASYLILAVVSLRLLLHSSKMDPYDSLGNGRYQADTSLFYRERV